MTLLPRTLFWRAFWAQMMLMIAVTALTIIFIANKQAETAAENLAALWAPALLDTIANRTSASDGPIDVRVSRDVRLLRQAPPADALVPRASMKFFWLRRALSDNGVPVGAMRVSGVTGDSIVWLELSGDEQVTRWIGVVGNVEGEDLPQRFFIVLLLAIALSALLAAVLSRMVSRPARAIAEAVRSDNTLSVLPTHGAAEIMSLADSVAATLAARKALEEQRNLMLAGISHDIRSPLARIRLAAQLLPAENEYASLRERIFRNVDVIDELVGDFTNYLRAEREPLADDVDIDGLIADVMLAEGLPVETRAHKSGVVITGNYGLLFRAIANLVDNARLHGKPPIEISINESAHSVSISVCNRGNAIDANEVKRLLQPFERGQAHRGTPGSGLGLAIVTRVAERHGGSFQIAAREDGEGTRATLTILLRGQPFTPPQSR